MGYIVDISSNNIHPINFKALKRDGCIGVVIKATEGNGYVNPFYASDKKACIAAGLPCIAYHWAKWTDPVVEANFFRRNAGEGFARVLDVEGVQNQQWCTAFFNALNSVNNTPFNRMIYGGKTAITPPVPALKWVADYDQNTGKPGVYPGIGVCWQYTSMGHVNGIGGRVDMSKWMGTQRQFVDVFGVKAPSQVLPIVRKVIKKILKKP